MFPEGNNGARRRRRRRRRNLFAEDKNMIT
jgi:hypothetical protein